MQRKRSKPYHQSYGISLAVSLMQCIECLHMECLSEPMSAFEWKKNWHQKCNPCADELCIEWMGEGMSRFALRYRIGTISSLQTLQSSHTLSLYSHHKWVDKSVHVLSLALHYTSVHNIPLLYTIYSISHTSMTSLSMQKPFQHKSRDKF